MFFFGYNFFLSRTKFKILKNLQFLKDLAPCNANRSIITYLSPCNANRSIGTFVANWWGFLKKYCRPMSLYYGGFDTQKKLGGRFLSFLRKVDFRLVNKVQICWMSSICGQCVRRFIGLESNLYPSIIFINIGLVDLHIFFTENCLGARL